MVESLVISALYTAVCIAFYVYAYVQLRPLVSSEFMMRFPLVAMVLRLMSAAVMMLIYMAFTPDRERRLTFVVTFSAFYIVMLVFDVWFSIWSQNKYKNKQ